MSCALTVTEMSKIALTEFAVFENEEANDDGRESDRERKRERATSQKYG